MDCNLDALAGTEVRPTSRPSRARGLKQLDKVDDELEIKSRPSRARGLKLNSIAIMSQNPIASITGAWIETLYRISDNLYKISRPSRARGLKLL